MSSDSLPLVSIITPVFNGAHYLDDLIKSVLSQDYLSFEHIIIDDGSNDNGATIQVLKKHPHLRWQTRPNKGQYFTMNEGLLETKGDVICFISADDVLCPGAIRQAISYFIDDPGLDVVYGTYGNINSEGKVIHFFNPMKKMPTKMYPYSLHISHSSLFVKKEVLIRKGLFFNSSLKYIGDYEWIVRLIRSELIIKKISRNLSMIRIHDQQISKKSFYDMREETLTIQKEMGISKIKTSIFRKFWFLINLINSLKFRGLKPSIQIISDRLKKLITSKIFEVIL